MNNLVIKIILLSLLLMIGAIVYILFKDKINLSFFKRDKTNVKIDVLTNYNEYKLTKQDILIYVLGFSGIVYLIAMVFYKNIFISLASSIIYIAVVLLRSEIIENQLKKKRQDKLTREFKDALQIISSEISSGKSFRNIIMEDSVVKTLKILYGEKHGQSDIVKELSYMGKEMRNGKSEANLLKSLSERAGIEDIVSFVDVFLICRKQGGNLNKVIKNSTTIIIEKMEIMEEINTIVSQKKGEQKIMTAMPLGMVLLLGVVAPDYMEPMYTQVFPGRFVMTISLLIIIGTFFMSKSIMDIEV